MGKDMKNGQNKRKKHFLLMQRFLCNGKMKSKEYIDLIHGWYVGLWKW